MNQIIKPAFQAHKFKRAILLYNTTYEFTKYSLNKYNEVTKTPDATVTLKGIYHSSYGGSSSSAVINADDARTKNISQPMLMCLVEGLEVVPDTDWTVTINNRQYKVLTVHDVGNARIVYDMVLEEIV